MGYRSLPKRRSYIPKPGSEKGWPVSARSGHLRTPILRIPLRFVDNTSMFNRELARIILNRQSASGRFPSIIDLSQTGQERTYTPARSLNLLEIFQQGVCIFATKLPRHATDTATHMTDLVRRH